MELQSQKYPNNIRSVSGTVSLYKDDVVLMVDTSTGAATINLLDIPDNYWSTVWKLYVVDASNNAGTNNITINAGSGQTINGQSSAVINVNKGSAVVRIVSNTAFVATGNLTTITPSTAAPYLYAPKLLQTAGTYYATVGAGVRSVVSGADAGAYDSKVEQGITGFNIATGEWTVPSTGYYSVGAKLTTRINSNDIDSNTDDAGTGYWVTLAPIDGGQGYISIAIVCQRMVSGSLKTLVVCGNKQILSNNISDVNIECSAIEFPFQAGDIVKVKVLNKTDHAIVGIASKALLPDCYTDFSVKQ